MNPNRHLSRREGSRIQPTETAVRQFVACVFEPNDLVEIRQIPAGEQLWCRASRIEKRIPDLLDANKLGANVYVGINPRSGPGGKEKDVAWAWCLVADFDDGTSVRAARSSWEKAGLPRPTMVLASGAGVHAYWRLTGRITDLDDWRNMQKALIAALGSDPKIHDPPRIMRLPGFDNQKYDPPIPCRIVSAKPGRRYLLASLQRVLAPHVAATVATCRKVLPSVPLATIIAAGAMTVGDRVSHCLAAMLKIPVADHNDGSQRLLLVARQCVRYAIDDMGALALIRRYSAVCPFPRDWSDEQILCRLRDAELRCDRGEALHRKTNAGRLAQQSTWRMDVDPNQPPSARRAMTLAIKRRLRAIKTGT